MKGGKGMLSRKDGRERGKGRGKGKGSRNREGSVLKERREGEVMM